MDQPRRAAFRYLCRSDRQNPCVIHAHQTRTRSILFECGRAMQTRRYSRRIGYNAGRGIFYFPSGKAKDRRLRPEQGQYAGRYCMEVMANFYARL